MAALIQFVDSISDTPTVRLDLNDGISWFCQMFKAPPPRLRRSESENSMRDGGVVGSSSYGNRTLELDLTLIEEGDEEWAAQEMQKLWRELDRPRNLIRYWPEGLDKPVFFRTFRSDVSELEELWTVPIARNISLEVLAEPFAVGLMETGGTFTVANNPATAGAMRFTVPSASALGDVPAPLVLTADATALGMVVATGAPTLVQAESGSAGADTSNIGGGPDAAMSGTGSNNFLRTTFATLPAMALRYTSAVTYSGSFRVFGLVRRSDATSVIRAQIITASASNAGDVKQLPLTTQRRLVDLGPITLGQPSRAAGYSASQNSLASENLQIHAQRVSGTGSVDWDAFVLVPTTAQMLVSLAASAARHTVDAVSEVSFTHTSGSPVAGTSTVIAVDQAAGSFPSLTPGQNTTFTLLYQSGPEANTVGSSVSVSTYYWPRYLFVRPVSS